MVVGVGGPNAQRRAMGDDDEQRQRVGKKPKKPSSVTFCQGLLFLSGTVVCFFSTFVRDHYDLPGTTTSILLLSYFTTVQYPHLPCLPRLPRLSRSAPPDSIGGSTVAIVQQRRHRHQAARLGVFDDVGPLPRQQVSDTYSVIVVLHIVVLHIVVLDRISIPSFSPTPRYFSTPGNSALCYATGSDDYARLIQGMVACAGLDGSNIKCHR